MKKLFLLCLLLSTLGCTHYFVRSSSQYELTSEELEFLRSKKIGLIGFYPFATWEKFGCNVAEDISLSYKIKNEMHLDIIHFVNDNPNRIKILNEFKNYFIRFKRSKGSVCITTNVFLDKEQETTQFLHFGKDLKLLETEGVNEFIQPNTVRNFLEDYLTEAKHLGIDILEPLLVYSKSNKDKRYTPQFKNFDTDYFILALHGPTSQKPRNLKKNLTILFSIFTLGTLPYWDSVDIESIFYVYDKNLTLTKKYRYASEIDSVTAWWIYGIKENAFKSRPPANFYKSDIKQFSKELVQVLKK